MGFSEVFPKLSGASAPVKASLGGDKFGNRWLRISLTRAALAEFALKPGDAVRVLVGDGANAGTIVLAPDKDGAFTIKPSMHGSAFLRIAAPGWTPAATFKASSCRHEIDDGDIHVTLPPALVAKPAAVARSPFGGPAQTSDVTASLMGDPKPGRSALDKGRA